MNTAIRRAIVTGDIWRTQHGGGGGNQSQNIRWLHTWIAPALEKALLAEVEFLLDDGNTFDPAAHYAQLGRERSIEDWCWLYTRPKEPSELSGWFDSQFSRDSLVVGFELPPFLLGAPSARYPGSTWWSPRCTLRRTCCWASPPTFRVPWRPRSPGESPTHFRASAPPLCGPASPRWRPCRPGWVVVLGQMSVDSSLIVDGQVQGFWTMEAQLRRALAGAAEIWFKPHPHDTEHALKLELLERLGNIRLIRENIYQLFSRGRLARSVTLSSSTADEAPWFGCQATRLPPVEGRRRCFASRAYSRVHRGREHPSTPAASLSRRAQLRENA